MNEFLAADVGGTNLRIARVQANGTIVEETNVQADFSRLAHASSKAAETYIIETLASAMSPILQKHSIAAIGIGFPGFFVGHSGVLAASPNIPQLNHFPLAKALAQQLSLPVSVQNDALCAAIGEHAFGAGQGQPNLLHITLGTGIGGGLILNNTPYTGEHGMAMEFGHLRIHEHQARRCGCGGKGCVEAYASATAIRARYIEATGIQTTARDIHQRALAGDSHASDILTTAGHDLGKAIALAVNLLDIQTITISGGLIGAWDMLYPPLIASLNQGLIPPLKKNIRVLPSTLADQSGLLGAAALAQGIPNLCHSRSPSNNT